MTIRRGKSQLSCWVSKDALRRLGLLQKHYGARTGLAIPVTQAQALEIALRDVAKREGLKLKGGIK